MNTPSEKTIDGKKFTFCKRNAIESIVLKAIVFKQLGPALPELLKSVLPLLKGGMGSDTVGQAMDNINAEKLASTICTHFDPDALPGFIKLVLKNVIMEGHGEIKDKIDTAIPEWTTLLKVLTETLKVEYSDFLVEKSGGEKAQPGEVTTQEK